METLRYAPGFYSAEALKLKAEHRDTMNELILVLPADGDLAASLSQPDVRQVLAAGFTKVRLGVELLDPRGAEREWNVRDAHAAVAAVAQSSGADQLRHLSVGELPADRALYDRMATDFPRLDSLGLHENILPLVQSKLFPRLKALDYSHLSESELSHLMTALESGKSPQLRQLSLGRLYGIPEALQSRVRAYRSKHPELQIEVEYRALPAFQRR